MSTDAANLHVQQRPAVRWPHLVLGIVAWTFSICASSVRQIVAELNDIKGGSAQALFIVLVSVWIVWRRRQALSQLPTNPLPRATIALIVLSLLWAVAERSGIAALAELCLPLIVWLAILSLCGYPFARTIAFALAYLGFALPMWSALTPLLQAASVHATRMALDSTGIPAFVHGNYFDLPAGTFEIESGCAGLHFLVAGLGLAALMGEVNREPVRNRIVLLILGAALAIVGNWVRIYCVILAGYLTNMQHYLVRVDHYWFGWGVFGVAMGLLAVIARSLPAGPEPAERSPAECSGYLRPNYKLLAVVGCASAVGPLLSYTLPIRPVTTLVLAQPPLISSWPYIAETGDDWMPSFEGADASWRQAYGSQEHIDVFVAAYAHQQQGKELAGYSNRLTNEGESEIVTTMYRQADRRYKVIHVRNDRGNIETIWFTYAIGQRSFTSTLMQQIYYAIRTFAGPVQSSVIALRAACGRDCQGADRSIERFLRSLPISTLTTSRSS